MEQPGPNSRTPLLPQQRHGSATGQSLTPPLSRTTGSDQWSATTDHEPRRRDLLLWNQLSFECISIFLLICLAALLFAIAIFPPWLPGDRVGQPMECFYHASSSISNASDTKWRRLQPRTGSPLLGRAAIDLPITQRGSLLIFTRGEASGEIILRNGDNASVNVDVSWEPRLYRATNQLFQVCGNIDGPSGRFGGALHVVTPGSSAPGLLDRRMRVVVTVTLPPGRMDSFGTDTMNYAHQINLDDQVSLREFYLRGWNSSVNSKGLSADVIDVHTMSAPLTGNYKAAHSLTLRTTNADIKAELSIGSPFASSSLIDLHTSRGDISGSVQLRSSPEFGVKLKTDDGIINFKFATVPLGAALDVSAETKNATGWLILPSSYEGFVSQEGTWPGLDIRVEDDPAGHGRTYNVTHLLYNSKARQDHLAWGNMTGKGNVRLATSGARVAVFVRD
ncbi:hypothetical protein BKA62DRAFT_724633 [Auriculariales sp. MPI-PUGE-AT-0066]|nr:hypothetical protein BKA62DRAFT_724633 [Auriculariales sp. MPI-PUGE-AT-0066]